MDFDILPTPRPHLLVRVADEPSETETNDRIPDNGQPSERFAGAIVSGLVIFAIFVLALVYLLRRNRKGAPQLSNAEIIHSTPLEWEPPAHSVRYRNTAACDHGLYDSDRPTSSLPARPACSYHDPTASQPYCWTCSAIQRGWQPPTLRTDTTTIGAEDRQFKAMGAYHDDYDPSSALHYQPSTSQMNIPSPHNHSNQVVDGAAAEVAAAVSPTHPPIRTNADLAAVHVAAPGQHNFAQPPSHGVASDSSYSIQSPPSRHGRPGDIAGRLSAILKSLDSLVEEMQEEDSIAATAPVEVTSLQRLKEGLEVVRGESTALQGKRSSRRASDAPVASLIGRRQSRSTSPTPGTDRQVDSLGDGRTSRQRVMT